MMKNFATGELVFRQGDPSDYVILVRSGSVEVLRELGEATILLGTAAAGEFVGEMGVLDEQPRSATVRAAEALEVELIDRSAFLKRVSGEPALAHKLLLRMSARLRDVEDRLTEAHEGRPGASSGALPRMQLEAATYAAKFYIGVDPIRIYELPYVVGRDPGPGEQRGPIRVDLSIPEPTPYRLSIAHFRLEASDGRVLVRDLHSTLGTIVNGTALGRDFSSDTTALHAGDNLVIVGGGDSPFQFKVSLG
jgi:CRP/FNR family cyclic AMP-dependent transcriptional regulator